MSEQNETQTKTSTSPDAGSVAPAAETAASAEQTGTQTASSVGVLEEQLAAARKESADNRGHYLRAMADLDNYRKRALREKEEIRQFGAAKVLEDLLPALDNLALGLGAAKQPNADAKTIAGGVEMVLNQLKGALAGHGLTEINPLGKPFDPHQHEAISHMASPEVPAEQVLTVVRTGYVLNGRLLRPASVIVSSGPAPEGEKA